jgi:hypothetical protein
MDMRVGRGDGSTDDADVFVASGQCATRGPKWSRCVHACGYGCWVGVNIRHAIYPPCGPPHQANHHTCGRGCLASTLPLTLLYAKRAAMLEEASLLAELRLYMW